MFSFFVLSLGAYMLLLGTNDKNELGNCSKKYPSGYELKKELRKIPIYEYDVATLNYDLIEEYIFREYVYTFEIAGGYTREVALRKALDKYIKTYNILDKKYKIG